MIKGLSLLLLASCGIVSAVHLNDVRQTMGQNYSIFWSLAEKTGYLDDRVVPKNITLFAPSNAAFAALPPGLLDAITNLGALEAVRRSIIKYHTAEGIYRTSDIGLNQSIIVETALPSTSVLLYKSGSNTTYVNDAMVISPDNVAPDTIVHGIDRVLNPGYPYFLVTPTFQSVWNFFNAAPEVVSLWPLITGR